MKYFGEYLVAKKIVSADSLVQAVLQQTHNQPLAAQIAFEKNLFSADEMIKIFSFQQEHQLDFFSAGHATGLLTTEKKQSIERELQQHHIPLAGLFIKNGSVGAKEMVHALDEFLTVAKAPAAPSTANLKTGPTSVPRLPAFSFHKIDPTFGAELQAALSQNKILEVVNVLQLVKQNANFKELIQEFLQDVLKSVHTFRGLAKAAKAQVLEDVCSLMDTAIVKELRAEAPNSEFITATLVPNLEKALYFCGAMKDSIAKDQSEKKFWEHTANQAEYTAFAKNLTEFEVK
jgi:hypothetical protein